MIYYKILSGLGDRWAPVILDSLEEVYLLEDGVIDHSAYSRPPNIYYFIGGSTNIARPTILTPFSLDRNYIRDYSGIWEIWFD